LLDSLDLISDLQKLHDERLQDAKGALLLIEKELLVFAYHFFTMARCVGARAPVWAEHAPA
jgi:hypothetical protein